MTLIDLGNAGAEPVSVAEAKAWCRIERSDEDALIGTLIQAARETIERETRLVLAKRAFRLSIDTVPPDRKISVPRRPLVSIVSMLGYDLSGAPVSFEAGDTVVDATADRASILVSPRAVAAATGGLEIDFIAGWEASEVPEDLKLAIKQIVAAAYEIRAVVPIGLQPGWIPSAARSLMSAYREVRL